VKPRTPETGLAGIKCPETTRVALTDTAYDAIASTLPSGGGTMADAARSEQCFIQVEAGVGDRMRAMRKPSQNYTEVTWRLVEL
jgi:hypothetical protein